MTRVHKSFLEARLVSSAFQLPKDKGILLIVFFVIRFFVVVVLLVPGFHFFVV